MGRAITLRDDFDGSDLGRLAKLSKDAGQSRRLLALAEIYDGGKRKGAARIGDVSPQVIRDWVVRFNGKGPEGLIDGVVRWRRADLARWIFQEYRLSLDVSTVGRELRALGFVKLSARPRHHGQNEFAVEAFKKTSPPIWQRSGQNCPPAPR